jgi:hypothetical protein
MTWRYQPVFDDSGTTKFSTGDTNVMWLCDVYFDESGALKHWRDATYVDGDDSDPTSSPCGATPEELVDNLARMMADAVRWAPVRYSDLKSGMTFEPLMPQSDAMALVESLKAMALAGRKE